MALHYLIDGYNLLYALPDIPPRPLARKAQNFLQLLETSQPQGKNKMTVIFDNRQGGGGKEMRGTVEVIYTAGESADDWLTLYVRKAPNPRMCIVVTDDQTLRRMIRGTGARSMATKDFLKPAPAKPTNISPVIDPEAKQSITEELKKRWL